MWRIALAFSLIVVLSPAGARAEKSSPAPVAATPLFKFAPALKKLDQKVTAELGIGQQQALRELAEAAVLADSCGFITLDKDQFKKEFGVLAARYSKRKPAEKRDYENKQMAYFGVYVGLLIAEATDRRPEFCQIARRIEEKQCPLSRYWVASTAKPEPVQK